LTAESAAGSGREPELSVVLVTDGLETIGRTLRHLRKQTAADRIELVLVVPERVRIDRADSRVEGFWDVSIIEVDEISPLSWSREPGIRAARAPIVALAESHTYHGPGWAEALIEAHRGPWAAVGPGVSNANPRYAASWANLFLDYGPWLEPETGREMDVLPGHNTSYDRRVLLGYGAELKHLLETEAFLHADMRSKGLRLWMEPRARLGHLNVTRPSSWVRERVLAGRRFGAVRTAGLSPARRAVYAAGSPLIPLIRGVRMVPIWRRCARVHRLPRALAPALVLSLLLSAFGEFVGYVFGGGDSIGRLSGIELHREDHVRPLDLRAPRAER
jgi:hypothetical protein